MRVGLRAAGRQRDHKGVKIRAFSALSAEADF